MYDIFTDQKSSYVGKFGYYDETGIKNVWMNSIATS
jgi:hypothetical protein